MRRWFDYFHSLINGLPVCSPCSRARKRVRFEDGVVWWVCDGCKTGIPEE
jgi:ribosomal protein L37AE/L43A